MFYFHFVAGEEWNQLSATDKKPYNERAAVEKQKYEVAMDDYRKVCKQFLP